MSSVFPVFSGAAWRQFSVVFVLRPCKKKGQQFAFKHSRFGRDSTAIRRDSDTFFAIRVFTQGFLVGFAEEGPRFKRPHLPLI